MQKSDSIAHLAEALAIAQGQIRNAVKDSSNPFFKSKYADLAAVTDACRPALSVNGLSMVQIPEMVEGMLVLTSVLMHASGEWLSGTLEMQPTKADPQGIGSAITYARRYSLAALVGVAMEDDDGNAASAPTPGVPEHVAVPKVKIVMLAKPASISVPEENPVAQGTVTPESDLRLPSIEATITVEQAKRLHIRFRDELPEADKPNSDLLLIGFISEKFGFLNAQGETSTLAIPANRYADVGKAAMVYARTGTAQ